MGLFSKIFAVFRREKEKNCVHGKLLSCEACEFLAETPLGVIHGTWRGRGDCPPGIQVKIFLPSKILKVDEFSPDENFFKLSEARKVLEIPAIKEFSGDPESAFVWFFPEDAQGVEE